MSKHYVVYGIADGTQMETLRHTIAYIDKMGIMYIMETFKDSSGNYDTTIFKLKTFGRELVYQSPIESKHWKRDEYGTYPQIELMQELSEKVFNGMMQDFGKHQTTDNQGDKVLFSVTASSKMIMEHTKGQPTSVLKDVEMFLESDNPNTQRNFFDKKGKLNKKGSVAATNAFCQGLFGNIKDADERGVWDKTEHVEYILTQIKRMLEADNKGGIHLR